MTHTLMVENSHTEVEKTHLEMVERATWRWRKNPNGSVRERRSYLGEFFASLHFSKLVEVNLSSICF